MKSNSVLKLKRMTWVVAGEIALTLVLLLFHMEDKIGARSHAADR